MHSDHYQTVPPMPKEEALDEFKERLLEAFKEKIVGVYLYGSLGKGEARPESDIDVLIVYRDVKKSKLLDELSAIAFEVACKYGELIEPIMLTEDEFKHQVGRSPLLWEVLEHGRALLPVEGLTKWEMDFKGYMELAEEYVRYAGDALDESKIRLAIDAGYNAIELAVKALIMNTGTSLAPHGGVIQQFGQLFVKTGKVSGELGKEVHKALILRAQARYVPTAALNKEDGEVVVSLAQKLLDICRKELKV